MPRWLQDAIRDALDDLAGVFARLALEFFHMADRCGGIPLLGGYLSAPFDYVGDRLVDAENFFFDLSVGWFDFGHWTRDLVDELRDVGHYARQTLTGLVHDALADIGHASDWITELARDLGGLVSTVATFIEGVADTIADAMAAWWQNVKLVVLGWIDDARAAVLPWIDALKDTVLSWIEDLETTVLGWINGAIKAVLADIAAPINLVTTWFDDIQDFFNDPLDWLRDKFTDWFLGPEQ